MKKFIWIFNTVVLIFFAIILTDFLGLAGSKKEVTVQIKEGDGISAISQRLKDENIVISKYMFQFFCKIGNSDIKINPGEFTVSSKMSYKKITDEIEHASADAVTVTIPEGFENREIIERLKANDIITNEQQFQNALSTYSFTLDDGTVISGEKNYLSGFLFPDTYNFRHKAKCEDVIEIMTDNFKRHWISEYTKEAEKLGMTVEEAVILASIIEREANNADDFKLVSSVFHNRLKKGMKLESCATVQYILSERKPVLSIADTKIDSPYNTYKYEGLPPTAIAAPGLLAIESALYPEESDYLFFFTDKNGITHFSKTNSEHNNLISKYGL